MTGRWHGVLSKTQPHAGSTQEAELRKEEEEEEEEEEANSGKTSQPVESGLSNVN